MSLLVTGIGQLVTNRPDGADPGCLAVPREEDLGIVSDAALVVEGGRVAWVGSAAAAPMCDQRQNLGGATVVPGFVDSHTHALFGGARPGEFVARMTGQPYSGSGIQNTLRDTRGLTDAALLAHGQALLTEMFRQGTTTAEIKSGYALDVAGEERLVRLAAQLTD
jgi:imidazolonepropionase